MGNMDIEQRVISVFGINFNFMQKDYLKLRKRIAYLIQK